MTTAFRSFVMFAEMRTGSNFLEAQLNALPGVQCLGEVFNPHFIGKKDQTALLGVDLDAREADPHQLLAAIAAAPGLNGFRYFHDHDPRVFEALLDDPSRAKIILTRNPLESYVSWKIAQATGQWKLTNLRKQKRAQVEFDGAEFEAHIAALQAFQLRLLHGLQARGQTGFYLDYEDIQNLDVLNGLAAFLGLDARLEAADATLKKQNPDALLDKVSNPEAIERSLARLDRFNLSRTPNFEPRRGPAIPSFIAAAGLLFMPMRGGPVAAVRDWLQKLKPEDLRDDFVQKTLRQWKRSHPQHRSFTVLRHPLLRAHVAFREMILTAALPQQRNLFLRSEQVELPPPGEDFATLAAHQAAFLAFLRFAKRSIAGQVGQKVDPHWASQSAVLQGFAGFQAPDLVLREERLKEGLGFLAAELGLAAPEFSADAAAPRALAKIWLPEMEQAAQEAWSRDYLAYGFGPWRGRASGGDI